MGQDQAARAIKKVYRPTVRADRFNEFISAYKMNLHAKGQVLEIFNISESGVGAAFKDQVFVVDEIVAMEVKALNGKQLLQTRGRVVWHKQVDGLWKFGIEFRDRLLPRDFLKALDQLLAIEFDMIKKEETFKGIPSAFRSLVYEIKNFLSHLKKTLDQVEEKLEIESLETKENFLRATEVRFGDYINVTMRKYGEQLFKYIDFLSDKKKRSVLTQFFQSELNQYYTQSPHAKRAFLKPLGYAGDFEMMNQIYKDRYEGRSLFGKLIHRYIMNEFGSLALRSRKEFLAATVAEVAAKSTPKGPPIRICSLACGPSLEIADFLKAKAQRDLQVEFYLIDRDIEALLDTRRNLTSLLGESDQKIKLHCWPIGVEQILEQSEAASDFFDTKFDLIYTAGLFDYLLQPVAQLLSAILMKQINPGGRLVVGNFHPATPSRALIELAVDWRLVYRDEEEMNNLLAPSKAISKQVLKDKTGCILYLIAEKLKE